MELSDFLLRYAKGFGIDVLRYFLFAGGAFLIFYVLFKNTFSRFKIQQKFPEILHYKREIGYSFLSMLIFSFVGTCVFFLHKAGYTKIYTDIHAHSTLYFIFSVIAFIFAHDTYFYWSHRLIHHKSIYPYVHLIHHKSYNPSPWATFAFHPLEAIVQVAILPIMVFILPLHPLAIFIWSMYQLTLNVGGHLGFEFFRSGFTQRLHSRWSNTSTHHNMHHKFVNCNYGLYFNIWDSVMGTNHPKYHEEFENGVKRRQALKNNTQAEGL